MTSVIGVGQSSVGHSGEKLLDESRVLNDYCEDMKLLTLYKGIRTFLTKEKFVLKVQIISKLYKQCVMCCMIVLRDLLINYVKIPDLLESHAIGWIRTRN